MYCRCNWLKECGVKPWSSYRNITLVLCSAPSAIAKVKAFSVLNQSGKDRVPYYVEVHTCLTCNGQCSHVKVTCTCPMFKPNLLCSHSVAVAEKIIQSWRVKSRKPGNFMSLATVGINTSKCGRKGGKVKRSRSSSSKTSSAQSNRTLQLLTERAPNNFTPSENTTSCTGEQQQSSNLQQPWENCQFPISKQTPSYMYTSGHTSNTQSINSYFRIHLPIQLRRSSSLLKCVLPNLAMLPLELHRSRLWCWKIILRCLYILLLSLENHGTTTTHLLWWK